MYRKRDSAQCTKNAILRCVQKTRLCAVYRKRDAAQCTENATLRSLQKARRAKQVQNMEPQNDHIFLTSVNISVTTQIQTQVFLVMLM
jgi:thiamine biosynthesis protein ThiC